MRLREIFICCILFILTSCNGQNPQNVYGQNTTGDTVKAISNNIMIIFQDKQNIFWFGSWTDGVFRYDGKTILHFTTKNGLSDNRINEIKDDNLGNIYFNTSGGINKFDGKNIINLNTDEKRKSEWKLESDDLWFRQGGDSGIVYRYDGKLLHRLEVPKTKLGEDYISRNPNTPASPYAVYTIYKDRKGNLWFGTNPLGVFRYNGKSFDWITEDDVTEFRNEGANGVRSIAEDKNGDFWFNTEYRYSIYDSTTIKSNKFYTRHESIGGLDGKKESNVDEYLSAVRDNNNDLWFVTYSNGVWQYDGKNIFHHPLKEGNKQINLFYIYKDNDGGLWLGTHENGVYKFNGNEFQKFEF